jgi:hypothetical protein
MNIQDGQYEPDSIFLDLITGPWIPRFPRAQKWFKFLSRFGHYEPEPITVSTRNIRIPLIR